MQNLNKRTTGMVMAVALLTFLSLIVAGTVSAARSATTVTIWVDADRKPAVDKVASAWGASRGVTVNVVQKQFGDIRTDLSTVQADTAPDVIVGAHDWTGELAANGLVLPLSPREAVRTSSRATRSTRSRTAPPSSASTAPRWPSRTSA